MPCRLTTEPESWRELLLDTHRAESELLSHADFPVRRSQARAGPDRNRAFETVFDPTGVGRRPRPRTPCCGWGSRSEATQLALRLRYRTDVLDADCAARIAGYHLTALELIAADLDAEHRRQSLLSAEEAPLPARRAGRTAA